MPDRTDAIELRGVRALATVGVLAQEVDTPQPVEIDLDLHVDLRQAGASDELDDTVDYGAMIDAVAVVATEPVALLETLAERIAAVALGDPRVVRATVAVRKLRPPVPHDVDTAGVRIHRP